MALMDRYRRRARAGIPSSGRFAATYRLTTPPERLSPVNHAASIRAPFVLLQGLDDTVCPPAQAERLLALLAADEVNHEYLTFPARVTASAARTRSSPVWRRSWLCTKGFW